MYYLRTKAATNAIQFTVTKCNLNYFSSFRNLFLIKLFSIYLAKTATNSTSKEEEVERVVEGEICTMQEGCISCGS